MAVDIGKVSQLPRAAPQHLLPIPASAPDCNSLQLLRRDVWMSALFFIASLVCLIFGLVHFFRGPLDTPLAISLIFMVYNLVPQFLLLQVGGLWGWVGGVR